MRAPMPAALPAALLAAGLLVGGPAGAEPADRPSAPAAAPPGWTLTVVTPAGTTPAGVTPAGVTLSWRAARRIPAGDAAVEFWAGHRFLGRPRSTPDGRTFRLVLTGAPGGFPRGLAV